MTAGNDSLFVGRKWNKILADVKSYGTLVPCHFGP